MGNFFKGPRPFWVGAGAVVPENHNKGPVSQFPNFHNYISYARLMLEFQHECEEAGGSSSDAGVALLHILKLLSADEIGFDFPFTDTILSFVFRSTDDLF